MDTYQNLMMREIKNTIYRNNSIFFLVYIFKISSHIKINFFNILDLSSLSVPCKDKFINLENAGECV